jgi:hypothetical protein
MNANLDKSSFGQYTLFNDKLIKVFEAFIIFYFTCYGLGYISLKIFTVLSFTFISWAQVNLATTIITAIAVYLYIYRNRGKEKEGNNPDSIADLALIISIILAAGILAIVLNRPDADDGCYLPRAVFYSENPTAVISNLVTWLYTPSSDLILPLFVYGYPELFQASWSVLFGGHILTYHHFIFSFISGCLIIISSFLLVSIFIDNRKAVIFSMLMCLIACIFYGETYFTYGNSSLVEAFASKYVFLTVGLTSWCYFSLKFLITRDLKSWPILAACGGGMAVLTSTALPALPLFSGILVLAFLASQRKKYIFSFNQLKFIAAYLLTLIPLGFVTFEFWQFAHTYMNTTTGAQPGLPATFMGQLNMIIKSNAPFSVSLVTFIVATIYLMFKNKYNKFIMYWILFAILLLLNPIVGPYLIEYVTTPAIYYRLFFLLPFPLVITLAAATFYSSLTGNFSKKLCYAGILATLIFAFYWPQTVVRSINNVTIEWPRYKIEKSLMAIALDVIAKAPKGIMLAPDEVGDGLLMLTSKFTHSLVRTSSLLTIFVSNGKSLEAETLRVVLSYLKSETTGDSNLSVFTSHINSLKAPSNVIVSSVGKNTDAIISVLLANNYVPLTLDTDRYYLFSKN